MMNNIWQTIIKEVELRIEAEPSLKDYLSNLILSKSDIKDAVAAILASKLHNDALASKDIQRIISECFNKANNLDQKLVDDILFFKNNDPACKYLSTPLLFYKGYQGVSAYRAANILWNDNRHTMALFIQNRSSEVFGVDIHPAASIDGSVMIDHATGVVIGETAVIKKNVSIFQGVTLGGKGFDRGDRHPKVEEGVSIFASSTILGNIRIGKNSIVAAGSLVLDDVDANTTVAGIPAKKLN